MMERRFDMANFEQSLKDHADQFSIVPSKKVWRGIYNDLHPGSKWPSIAMTLVFFFTLVGIGHLNNTQKQAVNKAYQVEKTQTIMPSENEVTSFPLNIYEELSLLFSNERKDLKGVGTGPVMGKVMKDNADVAEVNSAGGLISKHNSTALANEKSNTTERGKLIKRASDAGKIHATIDKLRENNSTEFFEQANKLIPDSKELDSSPLTEELPGNNKDYATGIIDNKMLLPEIFFVGDNVLVASAPLYTVFEKQNGNSIENNESANAANATFKTHKKRNEKVKWFYYVTPSISSVYFTGKVIQQTPASNLSPLIIRSNQPGNSMIYNARLGLETGTEMVYTFGKEWSFITGAHVSYSGYNIISNMVHPTFGNLMLRNSSGTTFSKSYITNYGSGEGQNQITLKNYNLQLSIPVGLQYAVWGNKNLQIGLASTIEPSLVVKSNAYLLSANGKNYISDPDLMRKVNLSGNFGSYVTFSSSKIKWRIGPSVRYQVLSTYQNIYPVKEHLIDYGIRIGISR